MQIRKAKYLLQDSTSECLPLFGFTWLFPSARDNVRLCVPEHEGLRNVQPCCRQLLRRLGHYLGYRTNSFQLGTPQKKRGWYPWRSLLLNPGLKLCFTWKETGKSFDSNMTPQPLRRGKPVPQPLQA